MSAQSSCPDAATLLRFTQSLLSRPEDEAVEQHLLQCDSCLRTLDAGQGEDTDSLAVRRQSAVSDIPDPPALRALIDRIRRLRVTLPVNACTPGPSAAVTKEFPLAAPQAPDEIGRLGSYRVLKLLGPGG